ncbi:hypothetical protein MHM39_14995 [Phaeobacter sp. CNT1-3]|nr:hypothetical protein [Phaeobacter sp. CNT1-3]
MAIPADADIDLGIQLLNLSKTVAPASWVVEENKRGMETGMKIQCAFDANHPQIGRYRLNISIRIGRLDQTSFHSDLSVAGRRERLTIYRLDLHPGSMHMNPPRAGDRDGGRVFAERESHEHSIEDDKFSGHARFARSPRRAVHDFEDAWVYFCDRILISNPDELPRPTPQGRLL